MSSGTGFFRQISIKFYIVGWHWSLPNEFIPLWSASLYCNFNSHGTQFLYAV